MPTSSEARLTAVRKWQKANPEKSRAASRRWKAKNPNHQREYRARDPDRWRQRARDWYRAARGIPEATRLCPEACECCGAVPIRRLVLDHCHETGKFRGWICASCNLGLGKLGDSITGIQRALIYLQRAGEPK